LVARIQSVLRRSTGASAPRPEVVDVRGVRLDASTRMLTCKGRRVETTTIEFDIIEMLMRSAGRIVSREELIAVLHHRPASPFDRSLDVHVSHLRKKLGRRGELIRTVRGVGYFFCAEPDAEPGA
jgi:two-component system response regulator CpxR